MLLNLVHRFTHLVELFRTDIGAVGEPKVDQCPLPKKVLFGKLLAVRVDERE